jgi:AraC-like DNA-binding protein
VRQLQRRFTDALGLSPRDYWMKCRIRSACESILRGDEKLGALSVRLGFCDQSSFTAQFRRHTGVTPSTFARGKKSLK